MAAYAALVSLLNDIHAITNHPRLSTSLDNKYIQHLLGKTNFLLEFIEGNTYGGGSKELQDLERQITSAAHVAEDAIEFHIVDQIHAGTSEPSLACSLDLQKSIQDMEVTMEKVTEFKEKGGSKEEKSPHLAVPGPLRESESGEATMVGLDDELNQLLDEIIGNQSSRCIISIVGMGGTGKTTLAKNLYEHKLIKEQFHCRAWAAVSQQINAQEVLSKLLSSLGELSNGTIDDLGEKLHRTLFGRRYLIVLDDIWSVRAWDEVKRFVPDNNNSSRILLTSRLLNEAKDCCSSLFMMNFLDKVNSWKLFCVKAFQDEDCPPKLRKVGKEIVKSCKGLALSIVVIGGLLLKSPRTLEYWESVAKHLRSIPYSKEKQESLDVLSLSYNHLPPYLKPCFLYMGVFKEDSEIHVSKIVKLWVAEGFLKPIRSQVLEEIVEGFIKDLIDRNLILVHKRCEKGEIRSCGIHDLLRELCMKLAEQEELFQVFDKATQGIVHRVVEGVHLGRTKVRLPRMGSILSSGRIKDPTKCRLLRVLDDTKSYREVDYYGNVNLQYIAYKHQSSFTPEWKLPSLIIDNGSRHFIVAPTEFWKMRQLRHVECDTLYIPGPSPSNVQDGSLVLDNLQTFKEISNLRLCEEVCKIISNIKELYLNYEKYLKGYDDSFIESLCNLNRLHKLDLLNLKGSFECLFPDRELGKKPTTSFPISLKKLSLKIFKLKWDDLTIIGSLPQLEVLKLSSLLVDGEGEYWSPVEAQFLRLKFLEIEECTLDRWDADESHFPVLEKVILIELLYLEEIPLPYTNT